MWLLSTDRAELHFFPSPDAVTGGYAILSHTWGNNEQTFQDTQALRDQCAETGRNPRDLSTVKVRECCILAERHGYRWVWDDTCCIDKTSSSELSEAINSMFHWYSCAEVCYAHMEGVESECDLKAPRSAFRQARWHTRGWTLQELIAPFAVIFVSQDWKIIGTKLELADLLEEITGVWRGVLVRQTRVSDVSVGERISWASRRHTTRVEDEAYSLMGLFNVTIPTIYGEGRRAFQRLQHEIMKHSFDTTLFAWDDWVGNGTFARAEGLSRHQFFDPNSETYASYLLAPSPAMFTKMFKQSVKHTPSSTNPLQPYLDWQWEDASLVRSIIGLDLLELTERGQKGAPGLEGGESSRTRRQFGPFRRVELPAFSLTSYGMQCRFPIIESDGFAVVVLLCETRLEHLGLLIHPCKDRVQDTFRKKYCTRRGWRTPSDEHIILRLVSLGADLYNLKLFGKPVTAEWRDIFIADSPPPVERDVALHPSYRLHSISPSPPFRLPHWLIGRMTRMGMELGTVHVESKPVDGKPLQAAVVFRDLELTGESIVLMLGTCIQSPGLGISQHWAKAVSLSLTDSIEGLDDFSHDCSEHHIVGWPRWTKEFGNPDRTVKLSFSRCHTNPESTLVVHIELEGSVYSAMKASKGVILPSRDSL